MVAIFPNACSQVFCMPIACMEDLAPMESVRAAMTTIAMFLRNQAPARTGPRMTDIKAHKGSRAAACSMLRNATQTTITNL